VRGHDVTREEFHRHLAERLSVELEDPRSPASTTLKMTLEEMVVDQEATRLGLAATQADLDRRYAQIDEEVRRHSGGKSTLADLMKTQRKTPEEFREDLRILVLKERIAGHPSHLGDTLPKDEATRIAQIEVVMGQVMSRSKIEREGLPEGVVARVNGQPLTEERFGRALDLRTSTAQYLAEYVQSILLKELPLSEEAFDRAIAEDRAVYERVRLLDPRPEMHSVSYEDYLRARHGRPLEDLRKDPYFRGLLALKDRVRGQVGEDDVRKEWVSGARTTYGAVIHVLDVQVTFRIQNAIVEPVERRKKEEAERIAADYARRLQTEPLQKILDEIRARKTPEGRPDRSIQAVPRALREGSDEILFQAAARLADGQWSGPVETLSEIHLLRRDRLVPAPPFEQAKDQVRHDLVVLRANEWLKTQLRDPAVVRIATSK
jgi:hypothetical protein